MTLVPVTPPDWDDCKMPASYEKLGIRFDYPENWTVDEEEARASRNAVTVYSPSGAFWSVNVQPGDSDAEELTASVIKTMKAEYDQLDVAPVSEDVEGHELVGYELNFYCLDLTNTAQIRSIATPLGTLVIITQAEDRDYELLAPVFRAMTASLLRQSL